MTSTLLIVALVAVPLGFLVGQLIFGRKREREVQVVSPRKFDAPKPTLHPTPTTRPEPWDSLHPSPSAEAMAGKIERLRAERNDLRDQVIGLQRDLEDLRTELKGNSAQLLAGARQVEKAEGVSRSAGARLVEALAERDEAVGRLQAEKASHAQTHRSLEGAESYLQLLIGHLDESGGSTQNAAQNDMAARVANRVPAGRP